MTCWAKMIMFEFSMIGKNDSYNNKDRFYFKYKIN